MNPHQRNKVDMKNMSSDERAALLYGKAPKPNDFLQKKLNDRKYFDSGDYALSKAGKSDDIGVTQIGSKHPVPENIPHSSLATSPQSTNGGSISGPRLSPPMSGGLGSIGGHSGSPVKESSFLHKEQSVDDVDEKDEGIEQHGKHGRIMGMEEDKAEENNLSPPPHREGMSIRPH